MRYLAIGDRITLKGIAIERMGPNHYTMYNGYHYARLEGFSDPLAEIERRIQNFPTGEMTMNINDLDVGDEVKCQIDDDPTLESGMVVNKSPTMVQILGKDPDLPLRRQGFLCWIAASDVFEVTSKCYREPQGQASRVTITGTGLTVVEE